MKKVVLTFTITGIIIAMTSTGFGQGATKSDDACKNVVEIKDEKKIIKSRLDSDADYKKYKKEADKKIIANEKKIARLKANNTNKRKDQNTAYNENILALEQKNNYLKNKIGESFITKTCAWPEFKSEFNSEMKALELAIKAMEDDHKK